MIVVAVGISWILVAAGIFLGHEYIYRFGWHPIPAYILGQMTVWIPAVLLMLFYPEKGGDSVG